VTKHWLASLQRHSEMADRVNILGRFSRPISANSSSVLAEIHEAAA